MAGESSDGAEPTRRHYWYSRRQHEHLRNASPFRLSFHGRFDRDQRYLAVLPDGRVSTESTRSADPSGAWPDYVYLGEHERSACRYERADDVPLQDEGPDPAP